METELIDIIQTQVRVMYTGYIEQEQCLTENESLVRMRVRDDANGRIASCVAVAIHPPGKPVSFRAAEYATKIPADRIFALRAMFNGRSANSCLDPRSAVEFGRGTVRFSDRPI